MNQNDATLTPQENKDSLVVKMYITFPLHVTIHTKADLEEASGILAGCLQSSDTKSRVTMARVLPSF